MSTTPLVSVVTPTYQCALTLPRSLRSLQLQTYTNWEWVVINDGSTDRTPLFLEQLDDPRIRTLTLERNHGRGYVRNLALKHVQGKFVCSLDADDWFYPWKLEEQVRALQQDDGLAGATIGMAVTDEAGQLIGVQGRASGPVSSEIRDPRALRFPFGPTMIRSTLAREVGFDGSLRRGADLDFFLRLFCKKRRRLAWVPRLGYVYRGQTQDTVRELLDGHAWSRLVYRRHLREFPTGCGYLLLSSYLKSLIYLSSDLLGFSTWLNGKRFTRVSQVDLAEYQEQERALGFE